MLVAVALLAVGCHSQPRYTVERVVVGRSAAVESLEAAGITPGVLAQTATRLLDAVPGFVSARKASERTRRFLAQVNVQRAEVRSDGSGTPPSATIVVTISLEPTNGERGIHETSRGVALVGDGPSGLRSALERAAISAVEGAVASFSGQLAAAQKAKAELVRDLASKDASVREHAMRVLADRGERDAVPALTAQLRDPDPEARERAVGALAQLRDPRAVPALVELVRHRDPQYVAQMARIVGDIGGDDARAWLLTMAFGHPEAVVRSAAQEALAEMTARELHARADRRAE